MHDAIPARVHSRTFSACQTLIKSILLSDFIPCSPENPKILRCYDAKIIGHTIAKRVPSAGHIAAQETEDGFTEAVVSGMTSVVGHVFVHQPPKTLDRVQMWAVGRNEMEPD